MYGSPPTLWDCSRAVARAAAVRRNRHRADPQYAHLTAAALMERVVGVLGRPELLADDWWHVGSVLDSLADLEFDVWYMPGQRRLGMSTVERPVFSIAPPLENPIIFDGERMKWIDRVTREPVPDPPQR